MHGLYGMQVLKTAAARFLAPAALSGDIFEIFGGGRVACNL